MVEVVRVLANNNNEDDNDVDDNDDDDVDDNNNNENRLFSSPLGTHLGDGLNPVAGTIPLPQSYQASGTSVAKSILFSE